MSFRPPLMHHKQAIGGLTTPSNGEGKLPRYRLLNLAPKTIFYWCQNYECFGVLFFVKIQNYSSIHICFFHRGQCRTRNAEVISISNFGTKTVSK
jgi:hypothetical protein